MTYNVAYAHRTLAPFCPAFIPCHGRRCPSRCRSIAARLDQRATSALSRSRHDRPRQELARSRWATRSSTGTSPAPIGRRVRRGARRAAIWSGATSPTTGRCATEEDGHVSVFRTRAVQQRQYLRLRRPPAFLRARTRRVVRYEHNGTVTVIADKFNGKPLNSPNDIVVHPDGGIWFTDPRYGILGNYEGFRRSRRSRRRSIASIRKRGKIDNGHRRTRQAQRHLLLAGL